MNEQGKLYSARQAYSVAETTKGAAAATDNELDSKRHDRSYNPIDEAQRGSVSEKLNADAARYRKGPGPV